MVRSIIIIIIIIITMGVFGGLGRGGGGGLNNDFNFCGFKRPLYVRTSGLKIRYFNNKGNGSLYMYQL